MELLIDTTERGVIILELHAGTKKLASLKKFTHKISEDLLVELARLLQKKKLLLSEVGKILVNPGPGGFSSTRTGVAVANALGLALHVPVADFKTGTIREVILPKYDRQANITNSKSGRGRKKI